MTSLSSPPRLLVLLGLSLALMIASCTDDTTDEEADAVPDPIDWVWCENADQGFALQAPPGWEVDASASGPLEPCRYFDPDPGSIADGDRAPDDAEIMLSWEVGPFDEAVSAHERGTDGSGDEETVDGRRAFRFPGDDPTWVIDLRAGRYLTVETDTAPDVADRMVQSVRWIEAEAAGEGLDPVDELTSGPVTSDDFPRTDSEPLVVTDVRAAGQDGFDRVVIEFDGDEAPSFDVRAVDPPHTSADGATVPVDGQALVRVTVVPVTIENDEGERIYEGQDRVPAPDAEVLEEVVRVSGDDGEQLLLIGLNTERAHAVAVFHDPVRLVVDISHDE
jgi:hypothetical protein